MSTDAPKILGINGLERIGELTPGYHADRKNFDEIIIDEGRDVGTSSDDLIHYIERDSTDRNPNDIAWAEHKVELVVDTTGQFLDPNFESNATKGSLGGYPEAGIRKVIASAPFKLKQGAAISDDAVTAVMGINDKDYDSIRHCPISNATCTTTCFSHMVKPLLNAFGLERVLSASMATVNAATGSYEVLDRLPKIGKTDLRKNRSMMSNIILTTTGAAKAFQQVIPEMAHIGFIAKYEWYDNKMISKSSIYSSIVHEEVAI